jgi:hypothetical protein
MAGMVIVALGIVTKCDLVGLAATFTGLAGLIAAANGHAD